MKFLIVFAALFALALAATDSSKDAEIIRRTQDVQPNSFNFGVETSDGFKHDAEGELHAEGTEQEAISVRGTYSFVAEDGVTYEVNYLADENGFQPQGRHLPAA